MRPSIPSTATLAPSTGPFVQIGTNEIRLGSVRPAYEYYAFWSGLAEGFHPHAFSLERRKVSKEGSKTCG